MKTKTKWAATAFKVKSGDAAPSSITVSGRVLWALTELIAAGPRGCTPITNPAPRWSDYVFRLRGEGVNIETIHEPHGGDFAGTHARYVLRSDVTRIHTEAQVAA